MSIRQLFSEGKVGVLVLHRVFEIGSRHSCAPTVELLSPKFENSFQIEQFYFCTRFLVAIKLFNIFTFFHRLIEFLFTARPQ